MVDLSKYTQEDYITLEVDGILYLKKVLTSIEPQPNGPLAVIVSMDTSDVSVYIE